jgi:hypothetical protein
MEPAGWSRPSSIRMWRPAGSARPKQSPSPCPCGVRRCTFLAVVPRPNQLRTGPTGSEGSRQQAVDRGFCSAPVSECVSGLRQAAQGNRQGPLAKRRQPLANARRNAVSDAFAATRSILRISFAGPSLRCAFHLLRETAIMRSKRERRSSWPTGVGGHHSWSVSASLARLVLREARRAAARFGLRSRSPDARGGGVWLRKRVLVGPPKAGRAGCECVLIASVSMRVQACPLSRRARKPRRSGASVGVRASGTVGVRS